MRLRFTAEFELLNTDIEVSIDCSVAWELGSPHLVIDNVLVGKTSLLFNEDKLYADLGMRIADMAERDARFIDRAVEEAQYEERAA